MALSSRLRSGVILLVLAALPARASGEEVERLVRLARIWATVKYLHPFMLQKEIDWDGAVVRAIPRVRAATTDEDFAQAVGAMLAELGDPATRVVQSKSRSRTSTEAALYRWENDVLVISAGPWAEARGGMALWTERPGLAKQVAKARQVVLDVRHHPGDPQEEGAVAFAISELTGLTSDVVSAPASLYTYHSGYRPQEGTTTGGYYSGLLTVPGPTFMPMGEGQAPSRVVFVTDAESPLPAIALALHDAGRALIVSDAPLDLRAAGQTRAVDLGGPWRAMIRVEQVGAQAAADVIADDPMAEALAIVEGKTSIPFILRARTGLPTGEPRWRPDNAYRDMPYPDTAHRLLAAFRVWAVVQYFYPYKALIGNWDAALSEAIPGFLSAAGEDEYVMAVLQMVARIEDGHSTVFGHPALARVLGTWRTPIEVREVEERFVVTRLRDGLPRDADVRVGDVLVAVDGDAFEQRVARLRKYVTASTDTARTNRVAAFALMGPKDSTATLVVRGAEDRLRTVRVPRSQAPQARESGEPYRIIDGNIGYVDLTQLTVPQVDAMFDALRATAAIVFDMRGYPRGTAWSIAPRINTKGARTGAVFRRAQVSGLDTFEDSVAGFYFEQPLPTSDKPKYTGRTVMLIDDRAISQAEHTGLFFEAASEITFVGTPTAGANGDVTNFVLPGGLRVNFTGHDVRHADGRQLQRLGIQPDIPVAPTIEGLRSGRDEVLERALAFLKQGTGGQVLH
ncbi:MAG TPA: S41 family peptidase [Vicinamibacterales bacterium]|nr:S41 family peptidase [Vicinamibacterales bacterium]